MMRQFGLKSIPLLLIGTLPLYANIDAQIDAIRNAPVSERFKLMNDFKKEVIHMHEKERVMAISKLSSMTSSKHSGRVLEELQGNDRIIHTDKKRVRPRVEIKKENEIEDHVASATEDHLENETEDHIENETEDHIENETEDHIENETEDHIENETEDHIENETEDHIENETEDHIEDETEDHIENETEDHIEDETEDHIENETEDHIEDDIEDEHEDDD